MLEASEVFERLHNEGKECGLRTKKMFSNKDLVIHSGHMSYKSNAELQKCKKVNLIPCECALMKLSIAIGQSNFDYTELSHTLNIKEDILYEIESRYEGFIPHKPHSFGELAVWLKSIGH